MNVLELVADLVVESPDIRHDSPTVRRVENGVVQGISPDSPLSPSLAILRAHDKLARQPKTGRAIAMDAGVLALVVRLHDGAIAAAACQLVMTPGLEDLLASILEDREAFEERAAVREYDGRQSRAEAELSALVELAATRARMSGRGQ